MRVLVAGAGPTGLMVGASLARQRHDVLLVDRDAGPAPDGSWTRTGVMQFEHTHAFRPHVRELLAARWPEADAAWEAAGAEPAPLEIPGVGTVSTGTRSQRSTFERALHETARTQPGLTLRRAHVDGLWSEGGRVVGLRVEGEDVAGDLVVDATGRSGGLAPEPIDHPDALRSECGIAYVNRLYRRRPGTGPAPRVDGVAWGAMLDGYMGLVFPHEHGTFSVLLIRRTDDAALRDLRHEPAFEAACAAVPGIAAWTDPRVAEPLGPVLVGGALRNVYRPQAGLPGLVAVGDAVATTTPTAGRGVGMCALQVGHLLDLLDAGTDPAEVWAPFEQWALTAMRPWVVDHVECDDDLAERWAGVDLDVEATLVSSRICDAGAQDPRILQGATGYLGMRALPESLRAVEPLARDVYRTGWRPLLDPGPSHDDLVGIVQRALVGTA
ncbi:tryptophan 7-halogenase [Nocardioides sp. GY 10127]|uniref:FAD-dependent oxidoreductase n=1 Tax=Nocardioides sp. GY 10127 TaxID=2569762 RepID=UPI0010A76B92|nr:tryptophan 7-halogenase [Nocardioides sp. GY 10127]TIC82690.1 FAD-dependent oxidoreductase [Nocardioides sp. GY 10127]